MMFQTTNIKPISRVHEVYMREVLHNNLMFKDFLCRAFVAEVGCLPSEACMVEQHEGNRIIWRIVKADGDILCKECGQKLH